MPAFSECREPTRRGQRQHADGDAPAIHRRHRQQVEQPQREIDDDEIGEKRRRLADRRADSRRAGPGRNWRAARPRRPPPSAAWDDAARSAAAASGSPAPAWPSHRRIRCGQWTTSCATARSAGSTRLPNGSTCLSGLSVSRPACCGGLITQQPGRHAMRQLVQHHGDNQRDDDVERINAHPAPPAPRDCRRNRRGNKARCRIPPQAPPAPAPPAGRSARSWPDRRSAASRQSRSGRE